MLSLQNLTRRFGEVLAVDDLTLRVEPGEVLTLLGPSGCGKTTTLRMMAGFESPTSGRIVLEGRDVTALPPQRRGMGMVFQNYALFPHLDVAENVAFGLRAHGVRGAEVARRVEGALARVELAGYGKRRVQELSGGQQQRVALARALAPEPPVLLLDEPLSNLDAALRERTRTELRALLRELGITAVFVTHDQEEAFALSDRVALLRAGRLQQVGPPEELYARPANPFVASFLGRASFLPAVVEGHEGEEALCRLSGGTVWRVRAARVDDVPPSGPEVRVMVRPEGLRVLPADAPADGTDLSGEVADRWFAGAATFYRVALAGGGEVLVQGGPAAAARGERVRVRPAEGAEPRLFPAEDAA